MLYYSKPLFVAIMAIFQLVWNLVSVYYMNFWGNGNWPYGMLVAFVFFSVVPPDPFMPILYEIVFKIEHIYEYRDLYCRAAILLCLGLFFTDVVVFLVVRAESDIGKDRKELERKLLKLIAVTERRKDEKQKADSFTNDLVEDHKTLLGSHYDLQSKYAEMQEQKVLAEFILAETLVGTKRDQENIEDLQNQVRLAEKARDKKEQNSLYWKKMAMNADASWRSWSKTGAAARIETRELKAKVDELETEAVFLRNLVERLKAIARGAEDDFVAQYVDQWEEIERLKAELVIMTKELDHADEVIEELMTEKDDVTKERDDLKKALADMTKERDDLNKERDDLKEALANMTKERDDLKEALANMTKERDDLTKERDDLKEALAAMTKERDDLEEALDEAVNGDWGAGNTKGGENGAAGGGADGEGSNGQDGGDE